MVDERSAEWQKRMNMTNEDHAYTFTIRRRAWWFWILAGLWLQLEVLLVQTALASVRESEYRAAVISWIAAAVLAAAGALLWLQGASSRRVIDPSEQQ